METNSVIITVLWCGVTRSILLCRHIRLCASYHRKRAEVKPAEMTFTRRCFRLTGWDQADN